MGGCAPYFSLAGMLRSSTNTSILRPAGAPSRFLRFFSRLASSASCRLPEEVCAEKFTSAAAKAGASPLIMPASASAMMTDLPTPVSPANSTLRPERMMVRKSEV